MEQTHNIPLPDTNTKARRVSGSSKRVSKSANCSHSLLWEPPLCGRWTSWTGWSSSSCCSLLSSPAGQQSSGGVKMFLFERDFCMFVSVKITCLTSLSSLSLCSNWLHKITQNVINSFFVIPFRVSLGNYNNLDGCLRICVTKENYIFNLSS